MLNESIQPPQHLINVLTDTGTKGISISLFVFTADALKCQVGGNVSNNYKDN